MKIGIPKESIAGETRVAATPNTVKQLKKLGFDVSVEPGAGEAASFSDEAYRAAGAVIEDGGTLWKSELIYKLNAPNNEEIAKLEDGTTLVSFFYPAQNPELVKKLSGKKINVLAMDMVPRISRAQSLDALSSMANIGGYRAVIEAAHHFGRFFTGQITAAGKVPPAKVLVIGAGVAAPALADVMGGQVPCMFLDLASGLPVIQSGKVRALAIGTAKRVPNLPNVPTLAELGLKDSEVYAFQGILGPKGLPPAIVQRLNADLQKALKDPDVVKRMADFGMEALPGTPEQFHQLARTEAKRWGEVIKAAGVKLD